MPISPPTSATRVCAKSHLPAIPQSTPNQNISHTLSESGSINLEINSDHFLKNDQGGPVDGFVLTEQKALQMRALCSDACIIKMMSKKISDKNKYSLEELETIKNGLLKPAKIVEILSNMDGYSSKECNEASNKLYGQIKSAVLFLACIEKEIVTRTMAQNFSTSAPSLHTTLTPVKKKEVEELLRGIFDQISTCITGFLYDERSAFPPHLFESLPEGTLQCLRDWVKIQLRGYHPLDAYLSKIDEYLCRHLDIRRLGQQAEQALEAYLDICIQDAKNPEYSEERLVCLEKAELALIDFWGICALEYTYSKDIPSTAADHALTQEIQNKGGFGEPKRGDSIYGRLQNTLYPMDPASTPTKWDQTNPLLQFIAAEIERVSPQPEILLRDPASFPSLAGDAAPPDGTEPGLTGDISTLSNSQTSEGAQALLGGPARLQTIKNILHSLYTIPLSIGIKCIQLIGGILHIFYTKISQLFTSNTVIHKPLSKKMIRSIEGLLNSGLNSEIDSKKSVFHSGIDLSTQFMVDAPRTRTHAFSINGKKYNFENSFRPHHPYTIPLLLHPFFENANELLFILSIFSQDYWAPYSFFCFGVLYKTFYFEKIFTLPGNKSARIDGSTGNRIVTYDIKRLSAHTVKLIMHCRHEKISELYDPDRGERFACNPNSFASLQIAMKINTEKGNRSIRVEPGESFYCNGLSALSIPS